MKIRESWLQNGIFSYKQGISVTKRDSWIINGILGLLFTYIFLRAMLIPPEIAYMFQFQVHQLYVECFQVIYFYDGIQLR